MLPKKKRITFPVAKLQHVSAGDWSWYSLIVSLIKSFSTGCTDTFLGYAGLFSTSLFALFLLSLLVFLTHCSL